MPAELDFKALREQIDQEVMIKMINEIKDAEVRSILLNLYNIILALWVYWSETHDAETEYHIYYYQNVFFDVFFKHRQQ